MSTAVACMWAQERPQISTSLMCRMRIIARTWLAACAPQPFAGWGAIDAARCRIKSDVFKVFSCWQLGNPKKFCPVISTAETSSTRLNQNAWSNHGPRIVASRYCIRFWEPPASRIFNPLPVDRGSFTAITRVQLLENTSKFLETLPREAVAKQRCGFDKRFRGCFRGLREPSVPFAFN